MTDEGLEHCANLILVRKNKKIKKILGNSNIHKIAPYEHYSNT